MCAARDVNLRRHVVAVAAEDTKSKLHVLCFFMEIKLHTTNVLTVL